jgi:hypothetical protein
MLFYFILFYSILFYFNAGCKYVDNDDNSETPKVCIANTCEDFNSEETDCNNSEIEGGILFHLF